MSTKSVLVTSPDGNYSSGVLFQETFVLTTASLLQEEVELKTSKLQNFTNNVTYTIRTKLSTNNARITHCFACDFIKDIAKNDWKLHTDYVQNTSVFLVLAMHNVKRRDVKISLEKLLESSQRDLFVGDELTITYTPFGLENFLNSQNKAIVSNKFGLNQRLFIVDFAGVPGSEGGLICKNGVPIGLVLCCIKSWKNSSIGLAIAVQLTAVLADVCERNFRLQTEAYLTVKVDESLAQLYSGESWGTAVLVDKCRRIFLTASHVIDSQNLKLYWKKQCFNVQVLFATSASSVLDLAVIKVTSDDFDNCAMQQVALATNKTQVGTLVV